MKHAPLFAPTWTLARLVALGKALNPFLMLILLSLGPGHALANANTATGTHAEASAAQRWLTPGQISADIALAREAYERVHPGYTRYATEEEMKAAWRSITEQASAAGGMSVGDFYLAVEAALTTIRCDHTKAELPKALREEREGQPVYLPFRWSLVEGRGFITEPAEGSGLDAGEELLAIDGESLADRIEAVAKYVPVDGDTEWARRGQISASLEFMGGALDHFGSLLWNPGPAVTLEVRDRTGQTRTVTTDRIDFAAWTALGTRTGRARNFKDAVSFERLGERAGYLRVDTFVNYRQPVDPDSVYGPIFEAMATEGRDRLILDLRRNGGGSTDAMQRLVAHLITEPMPLALDMRVATLDHDGLVDHLQTWDKRALNPNRLGFRKNDDGSYSLRTFLSEELQDVKPAARAFEGELILLTSTNNSSGSTNLIALLDGVGRATLVGEPTGGSAEGVTAGVLFTLTLPESGVRTRIPFFRYRNNVPSFEPGLGVNPDIHAPLTVDAFLEGRDPALEAALDLINERPAATVDG